MNDELEALLNQIGTRGLSIAIKDGRPRLTARVQGFPNDYLFCGATTRVAEQIGQAIPIQVGRAILEAVVGEREGKST